MKGTIIPAMGIVAIIAICVYLCSTDWKAIVYDETEGNGERVYAMREVGDQKFYTGVLQGKGKKLPPYLVAIAASNIEDKKFLLSFVQKNKKSHDEILKNAIQQLNDTSALIAISKDREYSAPVRANALRRASRALPGISIVKLAIELITHEDRAMRLETINFLKHQHGARKFLYSIFSNQKEEDMEVRLAAMPTPKHPNECEFHYSVLGSEKWKFQVREEALKGLVKSNQDIDSRPCDDYGEKLKKLAGRRGFNEVLRVVLMSYYYHPEDFEYFFSREDIEDESIFIRAAAAGLLVKNNEVQEE